MDVSALRSQLDLAASQRTADSAKNAGESARNIDPKDQAKVAELAEQFESIFIDTVFKAMRKSVPKGNFISGGNAEDIFQNMLDSEYAKTMSKSRSTGLASIIEKDLLKAMENRTSIVRQAEGQRVYAKEQLHNEAKTATIEGSKSVRTTVNHREHRGDL